MKRFLVPNQTEFSDTKRLSTAFLDLIQRYYDVFAKHMKDTDEPQLEHPTSSFTRTLKQAFSTKVKNTPTHRKSIVKKKMIERKQKESIIPSPTPKRRILSHNKDSQQSECDNRPPARLEETKVDHSPPQREGVSKVKGVKFASTTTSSQKYVRLMSSSHPRMDTHLGKFL